jgi:hemoglobin
VSSDHTESSFYDQIGGHESFQRLVDAFYERVKTDPILRAMYPDDDFDGAAWRLRTFLEQYWGGPKTYSEQRGHPRLRMRHQPFKVNPEARDRWLSHMSAALDTVELSDLDRALFWDYLERAAHSMVNTFED